MNLNWSSSRTQAWRIRQSESFGVLLLAGLIAASGCAHHAGNPDPASILRANRDAMYALPAYQAVCVTRRTYDRPEKPYFDEYSKLTAEKDMKMHYDQWEGKLNRPVDTSRTPDITLISSGILNSSQFGKHYRIDTNNDPKYRSTILEPWNGFYSKETSILSSLEELTKNSGKYDLKYIGEDHSGGVKCDIVQVHKISDYLGDKIEETGKYSIGEKDHLVRRYVSHISFGGKPGFTADAEIKDINLHPVTNRLLYHYSPPAGVTLEDESSQKREPLLPAGAAAPEFVATNASGKSIHLSDYRGKIVVLDFWASWCAPCMASMPHTQSVIKDAAAAGIPVVGLAVDDGEPKDIFGEWVSTHQPKYPDLNFLFVDRKQKISSAKFKVTGIPTVYVIDARGTIRASYDGYGGPTDDLKNAIYSAAGRHNP